MVTPALQLFMTWVNNYTENYGMWLLIQALTTDKEEVLGVSSVGNLFWNHVICNVSDFFRINAHKANTRFLITLLFLYHDAVIKWKHFPRYWPFVQGIHRSPVNSPHKGQKRGALMLSLICALNKRLSKQWWGWWFETLSWSLWRHCNALLTASRMTFQRKLTIAILNRMIFILNDMCHFHWHTCL